VTDWDPKQRGAWRAPTPIAVDADGVKVYPARDSSPPVRPTEPSLDEVAEVADSLAPVHGTIDLPVRLATEEPVAFTRVSQPTLEYDPVDLELHRRTLRRAVWGAFAPTKPETWPAGSDAFPATPTAPLAEPPPRRRRPKLPYARKNGLARVMMTLLVALFGCGRDRDIVLWHAYNGAERAALETGAARWNAEHPDHPLELVAVPYGAFGDKLTSAIPGGNGPDLFIYPQDRIGDWAEGGVIEPIEFWVDDAIADRFTEEALAAMAYKDSLWGLPVATKSLALFYRTDLAPEPPRTTDELLALGRAMRARQGYAVAYANVDLYGHAPWLFGYGGTIMDDAGTLSIATPEAAAAMRFARELVERGATAEHAEGPLVATLFNEGKAATAISGPWFVADIAKTVPWKVATLPIVSATGKPAAPFLGAEGLLMSARSHDKDTAFAVMSALTSDVAAIERAKTAGQVVPNPAAYADPDVARDPVLAAFRAQLAHTVPMPKAPAMRMVWIPYKTALGEVIAGRADPGTQLRAVEREVSGYVAGANR
jgi:arabinogalactan oligomer / maltooligosaccharide transport system substrate-binding protein